MKIYTKPMIAHLIKIHTIYSIKSAFFPPLSIVVRKWNEASWFLFNYRRFQDITARYVEIILLNKIHKVRKQLHYFNGTLIMLTAAEWTVVTTTAMLRQQQTAFYTDRYVLVHFLWARTNWGRYRKQVNFWEASQVAEYIKGQNT